MQLKPRTVEGIEVTESDDGFAVFDPKNGKVHFINSTGIIILELCNGNNTIEDIIRMFSESYKLAEMSKDRIRNYIENLYKENLLE